MATLNSPGVAVTVIDESFYTPAEPGTTPLIVVATAENKTNAAGTGTALATTKAQAGKAFRVTSQRDLVDLFGVPFFEKTSSGSPVHGGERNEYGLLAAYSYLGVSNSAFIVRADVDLSQLDGAATPPGSAPKSGQWWLDATNTLWGIQEWDSRNRLAGGQKFTTKTPIVLTTKDVGVKIDQGTGEPLPSVGVQGDYCVVAQDNLESKFFYKTYNNEWVVLGSNAWIESRPAVSSKSTGSLPFSDVGSFSINGAEIEIADGDTLADIAGKIQSKATTPSLFPELNGVSARVERGVLHIYTNGDNSVDPVDSAKGNAIVIEAGIGNYVAETESQVATSLLGILVGTYLGPALQITPHTQVPRWKATDSINFGTGAGARPSGSVWIKSTEQGNGARWSVKQWNSGTQTWQLVSAPIYTNNQSALFNLDRTGGGLNIATNALYVQSNSTEDTGFDETPLSANFKVMRRVGQGATVIISTSLPIGTTGVSGSSFTISESLRGTTVLSDVADTAGIFQGISTPVPISIVGSDASAIAEAINGARLVHVRADVTANDELIISHSLGGEIRFTGAVVNNWFALSNNFYSAPVSASEDYVASNWIPLGTTGFISSTTAPLEEPVDGQLWYNPEFSEIDIMVHNGNTWVGYRSATAFPLTSIDGPIVSASTPVGIIWPDRQLWVSTADLENFPTIYRWNDDSKSWELVDKTDQVTEDGVLFADARAGTSSGTTTTAPSGTIREMVLSNFLDPDAPDPSLYPRGMLLWNLRRSGGNVKRYNNNYIDTTLFNPRTGAGEGDSMETYWTDRWSTASANQEDGSGTFGRKAQHQVAVAALKSAVDTSEEIRDEERRNFNLIACPGYPELLSNLINLNIDRGITAFVVGDTPFRLKSDATTLTNWGTNANGALDNNETGIVSYDEYCSVFYPNGFTTDLSGTNAVVPGSHMMLRTMALSDQVSYPWFAPAGTRRGGITNATAVGYIDSTSGEFQSVSLNEGQRDVLYELKVNPITFFNGVGLVNYGQKTRGRNASALDRINVARLTVYLRSQLSKLARPYVFEPNDKITRDEVKSAVESLLLELVSLRAIYDFAVVCDESNNTPSRIDRNELYVDVAIEPVKAVEFIYIPLRVKNTGEI
jgi:hypothetical protein